MINDKCFDCKCFDCDFKGECHCPLRSDDPGNRADVSCDNYRSKNNLTTEEKYDTI